MVTAEATDGTSLHLPLNFAVYIKVKAHNLKKKIIITQYTDILIKE